MKNYIAIAGKHPVATAAGIFAGGLVILYFMGAFKQPQAAAVQPTASTVYSLASAAQISANRDMKLAETMAVADVAKAKLAYDATSGINALWADNKLNIAAFQGQNALNLKALDLDAQVNGMTILNAKNQFGLNVAEYAGNDVLQTLIASGYFTTH